MESGLNNELFKNLKKITSARTINSDFEYLEIDEDSKKILENIFSGKKKWRKIPNKWCINTDKTLAFVQVDYASSGLVRGPRDESYEEDLFLWNGGYGIISVFCEYSDPEKMVGTHITYENSNHKLDISETELKSLLKSSMSILESWKTIDYEIERKMKEVNYLKRMPFRILYGKMSKEFKDIFDCVYEVENVEMKFRRMCLNYYSRSVNMYNVRLNSDKYAFWILDCLLWLYLHKNNSLKTLKENWKKITNEEAVGNIEYREEAWEYFYISIDDKTIFGDYLETRVTEGKLILNGDNISLPNEFNELILKRFQRFS